MNKIIRNIFGNKFKNVEANKIKKLKIDFRNTANEIIKYILTKPKEERSNEDIAILKDYVLLKSKFIEKLNHDHIEESMQEIIIILSMTNAFYKTINYKNDIIYNFDDNAEYFYIIIEGEVAVLDIEKIDCEMNSEEYYKLILDFRNNNEKYLLKKTLEENKINFPIEINDVEVLDKILLKLYLLSKNKIKILKDNPYYLETIFEKLDLKFSDFGIESYTDILNNKNKKILEENEKKPEEEKKEEEEIKLIPFDIKEANAINSKNEEIIMEKIKDIAPNNICRKYYYLISTPELPISYYRYIEEKILQDLDYFGENESKFYSNRVIANKNKVELLCFKNDTYNEFISHMKTKFVGTQVDFLLDNFFFSSINKGFFDRIYLKYFEYGKYIMNQVIIEENEPIKYIYFVKSGNVNIYSKRNIIQNHILIEIINNILKKKKLIMGHKNSLKDIEAKTTDLYSKIKGDFEYIQNEIKLKKSMHIMSYQEKQCIAFECFYFGFNSLYTAIAVSEKVEVYKISIDKLIKILNVKNKKALYDFGRLSEKTIKILLERIIKINNMLLLNYSVQTRHKVHEIGYLMEKAINLNQKENEEKRSKKINSKFTEQKKIDQINNIKENSNFSSLKGKSRSIESQINNDELRKRIKLNKSSLLVLNNKKYIFDNKKNNNKYINIFNKFDLTSQFKIFDYKANLLKEKNRELVRESDGLDLIANDDNRQINLLKKQRKLYLDFFKLSQGEKRIFIKNRSNSVNLQDVQSHNKLKENTILSHNENKNKINNKIKKIFSINKGRNLFREFYPFNDRLNGFKPYKYDISKSLLTNKKLFEFNIFNNHKDKNNLNNNKVKNKTYKCNSDVDINKYNLLKKKMFVINCQDLYSY